MCVNKLGYAARRMTHNIKESPVSIARRGLAHACPDNSLHHHIYRLHKQCIGLIASELSELGIESVAYYGEMDMKSRNKSCSNWTTVKR